MNLSYSNLARADLKGLALQGVDLTGAYLYLTNIGDADLSGVRGLTTDQLELARQLQEHEAAGGLAPPERWRCEDE